MNKSHYQKAEMAKRHSNKRDRMTVTLFLGWRYHGSHAEEGSKKVIAILHALFVHLFFFSINFLHLLRTLCKVMYFADGSPPSVSFFLDWEQWGCGGRAWEQRPNITDTDSIRPNSSTVFPKTHLTIYIPPHLPPIHKEPNFADVCMQKPPTVNFLS